MRLPRRWQVAVLGTLLACSTKPTSDLFTVSGVVQGSVQDAAGRPVPGGWVAIEVLYPLGNGKTIRLYDSVQTDVNGHYLRLFALGNLADTLAPVSVRAWPPVTSGLAPSEATGLLLMTAVQPPPDTLSITLTLGPA